MPQVQIDDEVFAAVQRRAADAGYSSVDAYVTELLVGDLSEDALGEEPDLDHRFTPEIIAHLERISAVADAGGRTYSSEEVREHFREKSQAWENRDI
jgi:hypothetical protein